MGVSPNRQAPQDNAGGIIVLRYKTCEALTSFQRLHVCNFSTSSLEYSPSEGQGTTTESAVTDTVNAVIALVQELYDEAWDVRWTGLYHVATVDTTRVATRLPLPGSFHHGGSGDTATSGSQYWTTSNLEFDTKGNSEAAVRFTGVGGVDIGSEDFVTASSGGSAELQAIVGYLVGDDTAVRGHDGTKMVGAAHLTTNILRGRRARSVRI